MSKKAVIWISVVLYVLITLAIIGIVIAAVKPQIDKSRDKVAIEQTIVLLQDLDEAISRASETQGTKLQRNIKLSKGTLTFNNLDNEISWQLESNYQYSEEDSPINIGRITAETKALGDRWKVILTLTYTNLNITFDSSDTIKTLTQADVPYSLFIENKGQNNIDIIKEN